MRAASSSASASSSALRSRASVAAGARAFSISRAQAELHLAGGLLGERDGDDAVERRRVPLRSTREDALDQRGRLAGAGGGLDDERRVEVVAMRARARCVGEAASSLASAAA